MLLLLGLWSDVQAQGPELQFNHPLDTGGQVFNGGFIQDRDGIIWVPTFGSGLDKCNPNTEKVVAHYQHNPDDLTSIGYDTVDHVYEDTVFNDDEEQFNLFLKKGHND